MLAQSNDVFTTDEIARAAGVPLEAVQRLIDAGEVRPTGSSGFFDARTAVLAARLARRDAAAAPLPTPGTQPGHERRMSAAVSWSIHAVLLTIVLWSTGAAERVATQPVRERLVFLAGPGPGGGGGGGGSARRAVVPRIQKPRPSAAESLTPTPLPLPSRTLISPVALSAGDEHFEAAEQDGAGPGSGPGLDDGIGGGTGGGPYRPGSGIDPPRLLREVKAQYSDEARRRGITGAVVLEIVVRHDGTVGAVTLLRGLGFGLDERAVSAVRDWRFAPARRLGTPVDVIVEVEVEFSLR